MKKRILSVLLSACLVVGSLVASPATTAQAASVPSNANLLNTYGNVFDHVGNALVAQEILNPNILNRAAQEYNSITVGNEMKPDYVLGWSSNCITVAQAKAQGYYIPDSYRESTVPKLDYSTVDKMMKACYDKGLKMRGHTLLWHSQTPDWFFRAGYSKTTNYVDKNTMYAREEFFIKNYLGHCCTSPYAGVIYAWDVVNEYVHAPNNHSGWQKIYGNFSGGPAEYIKRAFQYSYDTLEYYKLTNQIHLFYNDFNTYMDSDKIVTLVKYINQGKKICAGVGMQSHLSTDFPSVAYYKSALSKFCQQGFEVQITELDVGAPDYNSQAKYYYDLMRAILDVKKSGGNITALVWWGMTDDTSWRNDKPLLYSTYGVKKPSYNSVLQAYFDAGYTMGNPSQPSNPQPSQPSVNTGATAKIADGWYYIKNTGSQKYLTVNGTSAGSNVEIRTGSGVDGQKWKVTNTSDGYMTLTSAVGEFMLDVANGANEDGANIGIYHGYSGEAQRFQAKSTATNNVVTLVTKASNGTKALDVYNFGTADGTNVCQWSFGGQSNQTWIFEPVQSQPQPSQPEQTQPQPTQPSVNVGSEVKLNDGWYYIKGVQSQKYLQVAENKGQNSQNVEIGTKTGADGQLWKLTNNSSGYFTLTSKLGNFNLDVFEGRADDGTNIMIYKASGKDMQQYVALSAGQDGAVQIATRVSGKQKVLDVEGKKTTDGANVCQYKNNGQTNQMWIFEPATVNEQVQPTQPEQTQPQPTEQEQPAAGKLGVEYTINSWGSGYQVSFKVVNKSGARVNTWTVKVPKSELNINASWNVEIKESGNYYVITPVSWNSVIENGNSIEFGVQGNGSIGTTLTATVQ